MGKARRHAAAWTPRRRLAWLVRAATVVVPLALAVLTMVVVARLVPRPAHGPGLVGWYVLLLGVSYFASWGAGRLMNRALPLAALLELSLTFPERAPSRLTVAHKGSSTAELTRLAQGTPDESTQEAAERILALLTALTKHDRFTRGHAERVRAYTDLIAEKMNLPVHEREKLRWAALLHDIGKLRVPATLLNKPAAPTATEWDTLRAHPIQGSVIAAPLLSWLAPMDRVIAEHHERWDGTGYPIGLSGESISLGSRIVTLADCFEAMTAARPYGKPKKREAALAELVACAGTYFDPVVVRAFLSVPNRRLMWAMGPAAWLSGLPLSGQGALGVVRTAVAHSGTALSATVVAAAAVVPASALLPAAPSPVPTALAGAAGPATRPAPPTAAAPAPAAGGSPRPTGMPAAGSPTAGRTGTASRPSATRAPHAPTPGHPRPAPPTVHPPAAVTTTTTPSRPPVAVIAGQPPTAAPVSLPPAATTHPPTVAPHPTQTEPRPTATAGPTTKAPTTKAPTTQPPTTRPPTAAAAPTTGAPTATAAPPTTAAPTNAAPTTSAPTTHLVSCGASFVGRTQVSATQWRLSVTVSNTGTLAVTGWSVTWTWLDAPPKVKSATGAAVTQSGQHVTALDTLADAGIGVGRSTTFSVVVEEPPDERTPAPSCAAL